MSAQPSMSATQWRERAAALEPRSGIFIDGRFVPAASGATFDNINPATGRSLGAVAAGDAFDVAFRANRKNLALLKAHLQKHGRVRRSGGSGPVIDATARRVG